MGKLGRFTAAVVAVMCGFAAGAARAEFEIPAKFVEYIESNGNEYIDLGEVLTSNTVAIIDFEVTAKNGNFNIFGRRACFAFITHDWIYTRGKRVVTSAYQAAGKHSVVTVDVPQQKIFGDGGELTLSSYNGSEGDLSSAQAYLFWAAGSSESKAKMKLYSCVVSNDNQLAMDLRPCVDENGVAGLFDAVTKRILRNEADKGAFTAASAEVEPPACLSGLLVVSAAPEAFAEGGVSPAYGRYPASLAAGESVPCSAPVAWTNADETVAATCVGYKVYTNNVICAEGPERSFTYVHPDCASGAKLVWQWIVENKVTVSAGPGGTVSKSSEWVAAGGAFTVTATADGGSSFLQWIDEDSGEVIGTDPSLAFNVTEPRRVSAVFASLSAITFNPSVTDYAPVIRAAVENAEAGAVITLGEGVFPLATPLAVDKAITLQGAANGGTVLKGTYDRKDNNVSQITVSGGATLDHLAITGGKSTGLWGSTGEGVTITSGTLSWCVITNNVYNGAGNSSGVGVYANVANGATVTITHCQICDNVGKVSHNVLPGAGLMVSGSGKFRMDNCLVARNSSTGPAAATNGAGAGLNISHSDAVIANCTFVDNLHTYRGGGVGIEGGKPKFVNCIIANNTANNDISVHAPDISSRDKLTADGTINASYLNAGTTNNLVGFGVTPFGGGGIAADPVFMPGTYQLKIGSPAIGYGVALEGVTDGVDLNGVARSTDSVDLGCYAYVPSTEPDVQVSLDATVAFNDQAISVGITHINPPEGKTLTDIAYAVSGDEAYPITVTDGKAVIDRPGVWNVKVEVYDGGTKIAESVSGMSVKIGVHKAYVTANPEATPVYPYATAATAAKCLNDVNALCIDGTEIELDAGTHTISARNDFTAAVHLYGAGRDLTWINGDGAKLKTGVFYVNNSGFVMENLSVTNFYRMNGGAVELAANGGTVRNCRFAKNELHWAGGNCSGMTILSAGAKALIENCVFEDLSYDHSSGDNVCYGVALNLGAGTARNCLFANIRLNSTKGTETAIATISSGATLENCTFADCSVKRFQNGSNPVNTVYLISTAGTVRNILGCAFEEISAVGDSETLWNFLRGNAASSVRNCCFEGETLYGIDGADGTKINFRASKPYHPSVSSSCRDAGEAQTWMTDAVDLDGNPRLYGRKPDIGCYECQQGSALMMLVR